MDCLVLQNGGSKYRLDNFLCTRCTESLSNDLWEVWATGPKSELGVTLGKFRNGPEKSTSKNRMPSTFPVNESKLTSCYSVITCPKSFSKGGETKVVIEIRVDPNETPGTYAKWRARELAQAVSLFYPNIIDASHHLSELGNAPGVMDKEAHEVFMRVAREVEGVMMQKKNTAIEGLLNRWKDPVLAACKRMLDTKF